MSLYQKYRPATLEELAGNETTVEAIRTHYNQPPEKWTHATILTGPSGCGKTTLGRAIAKTVLKANDLNIREINFASNRGIDTAREILEQMKFRPAGGGCLVYLIDEAHGMTPDAKRAFLKPLEDCPAWVHFFLITTNYAKLIQGDEGKAINTRCTLLKVESLPDASIFRLLRKVCRAEEITNVPDEVLNAIAGCSQGSPRSALVALEKVSCMGSPESMLKTLDGQLDEDPQVADLCKALQQGNWGKSRDTLRALKEAETDAETIRRVVLGWMTGSLLKNPRAGHAEMVILECFEKPTYDNGFPQLVIGAYQACATISKGV